MRRDSLENFTLTDLFKSKRRGKQPILKNLRKWIAEQAPQKQREVVKGKNYLEQQKARHFS